MVTSSDKIIALTLDIGRLMRQKMMELSQKHGVNIQQLHALLMVAEHEGITMKEFADALHVTSPSATSFAERLVRLGWVARKHDQENRKRIHLNLTPKGKLLLQNKMRERARIMKSIISHLPSHDQREFARILTQLSHSLRTQ